MNKLNNILREGGFPVTGEALQVLHDYQRYIHAIMSAFEIEPGTVVFLELNQSLNLPNFVLADSYIYVVPETFDLNKRGHIYKLKGDSTIIISDLLANTHAKKGLQIIETPSTVSFSGVDYVNYMSIVEAQLIDATPAYIFRKLTDIIESANYTYASVNLYVNAPVNFAKHFTHSNYIRYNSTKLDIQLSILYNSETPNAYGSTADITLHPNIATAVNFPIGAVFPLTAVYKRVTNPLKLETVPAVLFRESENSFKIILDFKGFTFFQNELVEIRGTMLL